MTDSISLKINVLVFGAGAIGTYIGGSLDYDGNNVVFVERSEVIEKLKKQGLHLKLLTKEIHIEKPQIVSSIEEALDSYEYDIAIIAIKSYHTETLIKSLEPYTADLPSFLCLQNGVENEAKFEHLLGTEKVIPGTVTSAIGRKDIGSIVLEKFRGMGIAATNPISSKLAEIFNRARLSPQLFDNPSSMKWSKLVVNLIGNATSAILNMPPGEIYADSILYNIERQQLLETFRVMQAQDIPVTDLPATKVKLLQFAVTRLPTILSQPILRQAIGSGRGTKMPSFHIDLYAGHGNSEVDYLNGAVVRFGEEVKIQTPVNQILTKTLLKMTSGDILPSRFDHRPKQFAAYVNEHIQ